MACFGLYFLNTDNKNFGFSRKTSKTNNKEDEELNMGDICKVCDRKFFIRDFL
jgi:hypothetical protein